MNKDEVKINCQKNTTTVTSQYNNCTPMRAMRKLLITKHVIRSSHPEIFCEVIVLGNFLKFKSELLRGINHIPL